MNAAGVMVCAYRYFGNINWDSLSRVMNEFKLPYDPLPNESVAKSLSDFLDLIPVLTLAEMREVGRIGLLTIDDDSYRQSTEHLRRVEVPESTNWLEALSLPDGQRLIAPQLQVEAPGLYLIAPIADGPESTRLATLDTGIRGDGERESGSILQGKCDRRVDEGLRWICVQGSCTGHCEPDGWSAGTGVAELIGCSCL
jgi:hypothetical protein